MKLKLHNLSEQNGVTLLISILILSGLTLISLTVAALTIQEIRSSRAVRVTEPAIAAAEGAGKGEFGISKRGGLAGCGNTVVVPTPGTGVFSSSEYTITRSSATVYLKPNSPYVFYLYDPCDINGDIDLQSYPYTYLQIDCVTGQSPATYSIQRLDGTATGLSPSYGSVCPPSGSNSSARVTISSLPNAEARMKVTITPGSQAVNLTLDTNQHMPNFPTVSALGCAAEVNVSSCSQNNTELYNRRIEITVPQ